MPLSVWMTRGRPRSARTRPSEKASIPKQVEPQLLTFASDRGMMAVGFEEIAGIGYYQGWWMQWIAE
ncbi:hypothetical protein GCM10008164_35720 [Achromobacter xylosoxidans]|nr:hypothetical protein GCM10008164_35720 [Achromobacter xylosoxidans]